MSESVVHDLRGHVAKIRSVVSLLKSAPPEEQQELMALLEQCVDALDDTIAEL